MKTRTSGQSAVLFVVALPVFLGAMGLAVDVSNLYFQKSELQISADAAALARVHCLPDETTCSAVPTATNYVTNNNSSTAEIVEGPTKGTAPDGNPTLSLTLARPVSFFFARTIGVPGLSARAKATAEVGPANTVFNALPLGLQYCLPGMPSPCPYVPGSTVVRFAAKKNDSGTSWVSGPGDWSAVLLPSVTPANTVSICPPPASACISANPGWAKVSPVIDEVGSLAGSSVVVPMVDWTGCSGSCNLNVYGFAQIRIISASNTGPNTSYITGTFVNYVNPGALGPSANNVGAFAEKLVE